MFKVNGPTLPYLQILDRLQPFMGRVAPVTITGALGLILETNSSQQDPLPLPDAITAVTEGPSTMGLRTLCPVAEGLCSITPACMGLRTSCPPAQILGLSIRWTSAGVKCLVKHDGSFLLAMDAIDKKAPLVPAVPFPSDRRQDAIDWLLRRGKSTTTAKEEAELPQSRLEEID